MPQLFTSDFLPDYFVSYDYNEYKNNPIEFSKNLVRDFEGGKVIYFENFRVDFDVEFFSSLQLENNRSAKKLKCRVLDEDVFDARQLAKNLIQCSDDVGLQHKFNEQAARISEQILPLISDLFQRQTFIGRRCTWRMLDTVHEDLHVDIYNEEVNNFQVRMFVNLDRAARIWRTSHSLEDLFAKFGHQLTDDELATLGPTALIKRLNALVYGGLENAGKDGQPSHTAFFDTGEVWLVDSRRISHQIFYGRRALSLDYFAEPLSMDDPSTYYLNVPEAYRRSRNIVLEAA